MLKIKNLFIALLMLVTLPAQAAIVSYTLDQSSAYPGVQDDYILLTLSDENPARLEIRVESLVTDPDTGGYVAVKELSLTVTDPASNVNSFVLPKDWKANSLTNKPFNVGLAARSASQLSTLWFVFPGLTIDDIYPGFSLRLWKDQSGGNTVYTGASTAYVAVQPSAVPVPAAVWLFASGLAGLLTFARRSRKGTEAGKLTGARTA